MCVYINLFTLSLQDYHHRLICVTEKEKIEIPVQAIGLHAILDFPDKINLPVCPVKAST